MRILWLSAGLLLPLDKGGKLRSYHLLRHLAARHSVTYVGFAEPSASPEDLRGMREVCDDLQAVERRDVAKGTLSFYLDAARHLVSPLPYAVGKYRSADYRERLARLLVPGAFDALVCDFLVPAVNMPDRVPCPTVLFTHNVEAEIWRRHAETGRRTWLRALLRRQWRRMLAFEARTLARFDSIVAVSDADRATFSRLYGAAVRAPVRVIPTGVDTDYFSAPVSVRPDPFRVVFTGSMDWLPNEDAVLHFCHEVLPLIRRVEPRVSLSVVGRNPTPAVRRLAEDDPAIDVTGRVDDVRPHVARAALSIVPLRIGGGTRLKIYESMAMGRAVVSTTVGAEGLPLTPGEHIGLADTPAAFAAEVLRLLRDDAARRSMEEAGSRLVRERYDWRAVSTVFDRAVEAAAAARPVPRLPLVAPAPLAAPAAAPGRRVPS